MAAPRKSCSLVVLSCISLLLAGCAKKEAPPPDRPRLTPGVVMRDVSFHSTALGREMQYRVVLPKSIAAGQKLPAVYLLHGGGGGFRDWTNYSDVARYAEQGLILVMPQGDDSYYTNSATKPQDRYEDYVVNDLIADVEARFPAAHARSQRAIAGVSMGGFGAVKIALRHPELFSFAAGISPALDVPSRPFSIKRIQQWRYHRSIFGPWNGPAQRDNDPYVLAGVADPAQVPYLYLTCGEQEGLLPANRRFAKLLAERRFQYEFHTAPGGHNWEQWDRRIPGLFESLLPRVAPAAQSR